MSKQDYITQARLSHEKAKLFISKISEMTNGKGMYTITIVVETPEEFDEVQKILARIMS